MAAKAAAAAASAAPLTLSPNPPPPEIRLDRVQQTLSYSSTRNVVAFLFASQSDADSAAAAAPPTKKRKKRKTIAFEARFTEQDAGHAVVRDSSLHGRPVRELLGQFVAPHIASHEWADRLAWGGVFVNGVPVKSLDDAVQLPCRVEYFEPRLPLAEMPALYPQWDDRQVVYEDADLLVVFKPSKLPTKLPKDQQHHSLLTYVHRYVAASTPPQEKLSVHLPSRLDWATRGLVLLSRARRSHNLVQRLYSEKQIRKMYLLMVARPKDPALRKQLAPGCVVRVDACIGPHPEHHVLRWVRSPSEGGKACETDFVRLAATTFRGRKGRERRGWVLLAMPRTGRTHQIRVHAASLGLPIIDDGFYNGPVSFADSEGGEYGPPGRLRLMCYQLRFAHPQSGKTMDVRTPEPFVPEWAKPALQPLEEFLIQG